MNLFLLNLIFLVSSCVAALTPMHAHIERLAWKRGSPARTFITTGSKSTQYTFEDYDHDLNQYKGELIAFR